jgi:hypothetical protein
VRSRERHCALGLAIVLIRQILDDFDDGGLDPFGLQAIERSPRNVALRELQARKRNLIIIS